MQNDTCTHKTNDGKTTILFNKDKWTGVYPKKIKGICKICLCTFEFTEDEYNKIIGGDN